MENKLQELTNKLYEEGLSKGRSDAEKMVADAKEEAKKIVERAREEAQTITDNAKKSAGELHKNTMTEISLAGKQALSSLKDNISGMIVAKSVAGSVKEAVVDPAFIREMMLAVAKNWSGSESGKVTLSALLPEEWQKKFGAEFEKSAKVLLDEGIEVGYSDKVKSGFKIGAKDGGYYISFSDEDFNALIGEYLKDKASGILYGKTDK